MKGRIASLSVSFLILLTLVACLHPASADEKAGPKTHHVAIKGFKFDPEKLEVEAGDTVVWTNEDIVPHTVTADKFKSKSMDKGESYSLKTKQKGDFPYICKFHPSMNAELIVR
jgi:plastocyanin